jgi:hypothetical protein
MLAELKFSCKYEDKGCKTLITIDSHKIHEKSCTFAPIKKVI